MVKTMNIKRLIPIIILVLGLGIVIYFDIHKLLSFETIGNHYADLKTFIDEQLFLSIIMFTLTYILAVAFSIPGATILSLTYGALLGTWLSGTIVVFAATIGATLIFLAARYALHDILKKRAGSWLHKMSDGFNENAVNYMLFLRLVPVFPFFAVNLAPAFMGVSTRVFILTTFFGIMPGTFVFASIGNGIGYILAQGETPNLDTLITPQILLPLAALGGLSLVPILYKKITHKAKVHD